MLREKYPPAGDGTWLSETDESEAYEAYQQIQEYKRQGYLMPVEPDYEAADKIREWYYGYDVPDVIHKIVDAAYQPMGGS